MVAPLVDIGYTTYSYINMMIYIFSTIIYQYECDDLYNENYMVSSLVNKNNNNNDNNNC